MGRIRCDRHGTCFMTGTCPHVSINVRQFLPGRISRINGEYLTIFVCDTCLGHWNAIPGEHENPSIDDENSRETEDSPREAFIWDHFDPVCSECFKEHVGRWDCLS